MNEAEVKILDIDPKKIRAALKKAGARPVFENVNVHSMLFDFKDRRIRKSGCLVRLRKIGNKAELTFKKPVEKKDAKICDETDVEVGSFEDSLRLLEMLGLKCFAEHRKKRSRYRLGKWQYEIDKYEGIPAFVEIEAKSNHVKEAKVELEKAVRLLGYEMSEAKPWNGYEVHRHYKIKK